MTQNLHQQVEEFIKGMVKEDASNLFQKLDGTPMYDEPLVGFASGDNALFEDYKKIIGTFHMTPAEFLMLVAAEEGKSIDIEPEKCTVICWSLPIVEMTCETNRREKDVTSEKWAYTRIFGEQFNNKIRENLTKFLMEKGIFAASPMISRHFKMITDVPEGYSSTWSERHALYAAGLGTFGLSEGLITSKGKAMRCGSLVALVDISPTARRYENHNEYCLYFQNGKCTECAKRCPVGAITEAGHDKRKCKAFTLDLMGKYVKENYKINGYGCGLCQTGVPCESRIPRGVRS